MYETLGFPGGDYFLRELYSTWHVPSFGGKFRITLLTF